MKVKNEKVNELLQNIPTDNITELNEGAKLVNDKNGIHPKKRKLKYKIWMRNLAKRTNKETTTRSESLKEGKSPKEWKD